MASKFAQMVKETAQSVKQAISSFGSVTSMSEDGRKLHASNAFNGEVRDLMIVAPYGISSCGLDKLFVQIGVNDNNNNTAIGVFDPAKPIVKSGEIIIYSQGGAQIKLSGNVVTITAAGGITLASNVTASKDLKVDGNLTVTGNLTVNGNTNLKNTTVNGNFTTSGGTTRLN